MRHDERPRAREEARLLDVAGESLGQGNEAHRTNVSAIRAAGCVSTATLDRRLKAASAFQLV